nr:CMF_HP1_G0048240.mRNA.1.CDS.1 [Saccharomyces cerevisiae]
MIAECAEQDPTVFDHTSKPSEDGPSWVVACREVYSVGNERSNRSFKCPGKLRAEKALKNANPILKHKRKQTDHIGSDTEKQKVVPLPTDI